MYIYVPCEDGIIDKYNCRMHKCDICPLRFKCYTHREHVPVTEHEYCSALDVIGVGWYGLSYCCRLAKVWEEVDKDAWVKV